MAKGAQAGKTDVDSSSFATASVFVGSLLALIGGTCLLYYYPSTCVVTSSDPEKSCTLREILLLMATITFLTSGGAMMICGVLMLCCTSDVSAKGSNDKKMPKSPSKALKSNIIPKAYIVTEENIFVKGQPYQIYYSPPPTYYNPNLVYGCEPTLKLDQVPNQEAFA